MGISEKLERLRKELNDTVKLNFDNLADEIGKNRLNLQELAKICQNFSIVIQALKNKGIVSLEDFENARNEFDKNTKVPKTSGMESKNPEPNENNK